MARVVSVGQNPAHGFSKPVTAAITLVAGLGVLGDAHAGGTVKHRSRVARDPAQPNLRQVHLIHAELFAALAAQGFTLRPGDLGENLLTEGLDLLALPRGTRLRLGATAEIEITGLRNPCVQIERFQPGLLAAVLDRTPDGRLIRKAGVMAVVLAGGEVRAGDAIGVALLAQPHPLDAV
jgi:MOSC domain-containing protein YiiM